MTQKVAVITGAGTGIGRVTAQLLAQQGYALTLLGRNTERLEETAKAVETLKTKALILITDIADPKAIEEAAALAESLGPIIVWVNCADALIVGNITQFTVEEIRRATDVNYLGTLYSTRTALRHMKRQNDGVIVNLVNNFPPLPLRSLDSAAKAGIRAFSASVRRELIYNKSNIHLAVVHLPMINTYRFFWARNHTGKQLHAFGRCYDPEIAAKAICTAISRRHRDVWVGTSGIKYWLLSYLSPNLLDRILASQGHKQQLIDNPDYYGTKDNLFISPDLSATLKNYLARNPTKTFRTPFFFTPLHKFLCYLSTLFCGFLIGVFLKKHK